MSEYGVVDKGSYVTDEPMPDLRHKLADRQGQRRQAVGTNGVSYEDVLYLMEALRNQRLLAGVATDDDLSETMPPGWKSYSGCSLNELGKGYTYKPGKPVQKPVVTPRSQDTWDTLNAAGLGQPSPTTAAPAAEPAEKASGQQSELTQEVLEALRLAAYQD
jgi:hypothetical protein